MPELITSPVNAVIISLSEQKALPDELREYYHLSEDGTAASFIEQHPGLADTLLEALPHLRQYVGQEPMILLRAPFDDEGWQLLYAVVRWPGDATQIYLAIDRFADEWWIPNSGPAFEFLSFTYELV